MHTRISHANAGTEGEHSYGDAQHPLLQTLVLVAWPCLHIWNSESVVQGLLQPPPPPPAKVPHAWPRSKAVDSKPDPDDSNRYIFMVKIKRG